MFKKILSVILFCGFLLPSNYTFSAAAVGASPVEEDHFVSDERVNHLPQKLRQHALGFYESFNEACRAVPETDKKAVILNGKTHVSFVDHYAPEILDRPRAAAAASTVSSARTRKNPLENRLVRFIDWIIAKDGIGTSQDDSISTKIEGTMVDIHIEYKNKAATREIDFFKTHFIPMLDKLSMKNNPIAQCIKGLMIFHGIGEKEDKDYAGDLLLSSTQGHYGRAANFLHIYKDKFGFPKEKSDEVERLQKILDKTAPVKQYLEPYITTRDDLSYISDRKIDRLKEILRVLPGDTSRLLGVYSNLSRLLAEHLSEPSPSALIFGEIIFNICSISIDGITLAGYSLWASKEDDLWQSNTIIYIATGASLAIETLKSAGLLIKNIINYNGCCRPSNNAKNLLGTIDRGVLLDEARLAALYFVAKKYKEILSDDEGTPLVEKYLKEIWDLFKEKPIGKGVSIARHLLENIDK